MKNTKIPPEQQNIFVDIFPLDCVDLSKSTYIHVGKLINKIRVLFFEKISKTPMFGIPYHLFSRLIPQNFLRLFFLFLTQKKEETPQSDAHIFYGDPTFLDKYVLYSEEGKLPIVKHKFEDREYNIPRDFDSYLRGLYGDYMTLPPEDKRQTHKPVQIDFGE